MNSGGARETHCNPAQIDAPDIESRLSCYHSRYSFYERDVTLVRDATNSVIYSRIGEIVTTAVRSDGCA